MNKIPKKGLRLSACGRALTVILFGVMSSLAVDSRAHPPVEEFMVDIPAGKFKMGEGRRARLVTISKGFKMLKTEVTQAQWKMIMGYLPAIKQPCSKCPVYMVSWNDVQDFLKKLNSRGDPFTYRLPTSAEWEYACRAGTEGDYAGDINLLAWYMETSPTPGPQPVATKKPNAWGLYDMHGNVWEWVSDWFGYEDDGSLDPKGPDTGTQKVIRGGNWGGNGGDVRSLKRLAQSPTFHGWIGFRFVAVAKE